MTSTPKRPVGVYNLYDIQKDYIVRILEEVPGRKVLVLDKQSEELFSEVMTQSELLHYEVYLVERLEKLGQEKDLDAMRTVLIVAPTVENINAISAELEGYSVTTCYICNHPLHADFTGPVEDRHLEQLALRDATSNRIQSVKEICSNFAIINRKSFVLTSIHQNGILLFDD
jgi:vacuolar protein sorting-associated protein 45